MKAVTLLLSGLLLGYLFSRRRRPLCLDVNIETEEMATPSIFRRTVKLRYRPVTPVSKGVTTAPA
ncbi:MAG: hypothetical protein WBW84_18610 [Acidobacteriaceae bacterium]